MAQTRLDDKENKKNAKKEEAEQKEAEIFATAKNTNEKQLIKKFMVDCQSRNEECSMDIVCVYAMPDGTKIETVNHTW